MPQVTANGIKLEYDEFGDQAAPTILLIMGLSMQMTAWREPFCDEFVQAGFRVVRFDNRDIGLSHKCQGAKAPPFLSSLTKAFLGRTFPTPYTLEDMAADTVGLLDALEIDKAHIVGASMGGMIAQVVAGHHSERVRSLTSIMSTSGKARHTIPQWRVARHMFFTRPKSTDVEDMVVYAKKLWKLIGSPGYPIDPADIEAHIRENIARSFYPAGYLRQMSAILANGCRRELLQQITTPTLVLHGSHDPLVPLAGGQDTAAHIPGARLEVIEGMGHNLPPQLYQRITSLIIQHARHAEAAQNAS